jgi:CspA family cold shock protein
LPRHSQKNHKVCPVCGERVRSEDYVGYGDRKQCWRCGTVFKLRSPVSQTQWDEVKNQREAGRVRSWSSQKGYGFIEREDGSEAFVHRSEVAGYGGESLIEGQVVTFRVDTSVRGPRAIEVNTFAPQPTDLVYATSGEAFLARPDREQTLLMLNDDASFSYASVTTDAPAPVQAMDDGLRAVLVVGGVRMLRVEEDLAAAFEALLSKQDLREQDIQRFLEAHPEFLLGSEYDVAIPQVVLPLGAGDSLRPDFVLRPLAGVTWDAKIVELKLPGQPLLRKRPVHREAVFASVHNAVTQLRSYQRYFDEEANRAAFMRRMGFGVNRPKLALVLGRTEDFPPLERLANVVADIAPVDLLSYDDLIIRYRRLVQWQQQ